MTDRSVLAMKWNGNVYVDTVLPFGLRSVPKIFTAIADALEWILKHQGVSFILHYLDDFLTLGQAHSSECEHNLERIVEVCKYLGVPLKVQKMEGPTTTLDNVDFLGITMDTETLKVTLPTCELEELKRWLGSGPEDPAT